MMAMVRTKLSLVLYSASAEAATIAKDGADVGLAQKKSLNPQTEKVSFLVRDHQYRVKRWPFPG